MNLFKSKKNLLLLVSSVIVWAGVCLLAMHWNTMYDGALGGFPTYLWVFAPIVLLFSLFENSHPSKPAQPGKKNHRRWAQALVVFLVALMLFIALGSGINPLYFQGFWWLAAMAVLSVLGALLAKFVLHPTESSPLRPAAGTIFLLYLSYAIAQVGMSAVLHPVTVDDIIRTGEAAGGRSGEYVGRLDDESGEHPLGVYLFTSLDKSQWYYFDVLTGEPTSDFHSTYEPN